ncbi:hypothetical protein [Pedobacter metabolipauper]|uniref:Uncharacterized protein n=1 Tax=Pedobacter metabolipauper TaxID=425513 RepID=A0A4R6T329_9SPHI|nr:hypothetical protein [Pedobacter metabolipauper]TDQ11940.1 hypothetical protein ATK78_1070 [Pedobacter metabolipauper]
MKIITPLFALILLLTACGGNTEKIQLRAPEQSTADSTSAKLSTDSVAVDTTIIP